MTGAVHDDVPDALAHVTLAEGRPPESEVFQPVVAAAEHKKAGNTSFADGVQVASKTIQQATSNVDPMRPDIFHFRYSIAKRTKFP